MLASIHPLGERTRGGRYWFTAMSFVVGSTLGGAAIGAAAGGAGAIAFAIAEPTATMRLAALGVVAGVLVAIELGAFGASLPTGDGR